MKIKYFKKLSDILFNIEVTTPGEKLSLVKVINRIAKQIATLNKKENKVILVGNGGSSSIASHIAADFLKNAQVPALAFNDACLLTCLSNDFGYEYVFQKPIEILCKKGDILFAISSSGQSQNILFAAKEAKHRDCLVISLSGFNKRNPLRQLGEVNFYVPSSSYGFVEISHLALCHCIVDTILDNND